MKILFIGHSASRTGAPISLLRIIRWLKQEKKIVPYILLAKGGELVPEYEKLGKTYVCQNIDDPTKPANFRLKTFIKWWLNKKFGLKQHNSLILELKNIYENQDFDAVFCNTSTNGLLLDALSFIDAPVLTRIAEMKGDINYFDINNQFECVKRHTDVFIAVSKSVKNDLINFYHIDSNNIKVIHGAIEPVTHIPPTNLRLKLGLPLNTFIVGSSGKGLLRKGFDLFIHLAHIINTHHNVNIAFVWLGGERNYYFEQFWSDIQKTDLKNNFFVIEQKPNSLSYYQDFDVFILLSREDPFPLTALENAMLGNPVLAFTQTGGVGELLQDTDMIVPYFNFSALSDKIISYYTHSDSIINDGNLLRNRVIKNYTMAQSGEKFYEAILSLIK